MLCLVNIVGASASETPICVYLLHNDRWKGVRHGMSIVRFEYDVWYLWQGMEKEEQEELCI
jgi:hypothetical protein